MADDSEEDSNKELKEEKALNESYSNQDPHSSRLLQKTQLSSPFASPINKRPFAHCNQEDKKELGKRTKYNCDDSTACQQSLKERTEGKRDLLNILRKKEDILRKLNLVKMYRAKNNLSDLEELISKWRSISQTAAQDLFDKFSKDKVLNMGQFLDGMRVGHELIKYCVEDETFY